MCLGNGVCLHSSDSDHWAGLSGELGMSCEEQRLMQLNLPSTVDSLEDDLLHKTQDHVKLKGRGLEYFSWGQRDLVCHENCRILLEVNTL